MSRSGGQPGDLTLHLSELLRLPILDRGGERVGRVRDVIVRLRSDEYPRVSGFLAGVGRRDVFLNIEQVASVEREGLHLAQERVDLRRFARRTGEVMLRADVLGNRLIDVRAGRLVRAKDIELARRGDQWLVEGVDTRPRALRDLLRLRPREHESRDWKSFEPLIGDIPGVPRRWHFGRLRRLHPAQIADLLQEASGDEGRDIMEAVHQDPDLEADVFEELEADHQVRLLESRNDQEVAAVLSRMRPDDAADLLAELPQERRKPVLALLPEPMRTKIRTLASFNPTSAGGLMNPDFLSFPATVTAAEVLQRVRGAPDLADGVLVVALVLDESGSLSRAVSLIELLQSNPEARLGDLGVKDPVAVRASADVAEVALLMTDYNLGALPVVDDQGHLIGLITVDDVLEAIVPEEWRRREQGMPADARRAPR